MKQINTLRRLCIGVFAGSVAGLLAGVPASAAVGDLYVTEEGPGNVWQFNGVTGASMGFFNAAPLTGNIMAIHTGGAVGDVLVGSAFGGAGVRRLDRNTGAVVQTYNAGGGWQWAGVWRPGTNTVLIGDMSTDDIREYDADTGAYLGTFATGVNEPSDMVFGPNGNLFVCSYAVGAGVYEIDGVTGAVLNQWGLGMGHTNDIVFMPDGRRIVTAMGDNMAHVFDSSWNPITTFAGTGWGRIHGIALSPHDGRIYAVDGLTTNVHSFDPVTYAEIDASFSSTNTKPVDLEFRPAIPAPGAAGVLGLGVVAVLRRRRR
ncbi:MAG: WD40 repeat domain-containing protein [Phycisphaeraceae bacterium]|nr:WD40 repeat domain-containing protein [Phycisphaeraceae bacterium]